MTVISKSKVCGMNKKRRIELQCALMAPVSKSKVGGMHEEAEWS